MNLFKYIDIIIFYFIFVVTIPIILIFTKINMLKFYLPILITLANSISILKPFEKFSDLYGNQSIISKYSTLILKIFVIIGIYTQIILNTQMKSNFIINIIYGVLIFLITFQFADEGIKILYNGINTKFENKTENQKKSIKLLLVLFIIILIFAIQIIFFNLVNLSNNYIEIKNTLNTNKKIKNNMSLSSVDNIFAV
jgi:hypothetical protein